MNEIMVINPNIMIFLFVQSDTIYFMKKVVISFLILLRNILLEKLKNLSNILNFFQ